MAQQTALQYFVQVPSKNDITLSWATNPNYSCDRMEVEHSTDSFFLSPTTIYTGTFVQSSSVLTYECTHTGVDKSQTNYYRLNLGACGYSSILKANSGSGTNYFLYPNPFRESATLIFQNPLNYTVNLYVFDKNGQMLTKSPAFRGNTYLLLRELFQPGVYYFGIANENELVSWGRFVVEN